MTEGFQLMFLHASSIILPEAFVELTELFCRVFFVIERTADCKKLAVHARRPGWLFRLYGRI